MKVQKSRRLNKTDFPDAPEWTDQLFQVLNTQFERWVTLFQNNNTFADNVRSETVTLDLTHGVDTLIKLQILERSPSMGFFAGSNYFEDWKFIWEATEDPLTVKVRVTWDVPPDEEVRVTLLFVDE